MRPSECRTRPASKRRQLTGPIPRPESASRIGVDSNETLLLGPRDSAVIEEGQ